MNELERLFNESERDMLGYALLCAINEVNCYLKAYQSCYVDLEFAKECFDNLCTLKSLYRRFFPNLSVELLFGGEDDEK